MLGAFRAYYDDLKKGKKKENKKADGHALLPHRQIPLCSHTPRSPPGALSIRANQSLRYVTSKRCI